MVEGYGFCIDTRGVGLIHCFMNEAGYFLGSFMGGDLDAQGQVKISGPWRDDAGCAAGTLQDIDA